MPDLFVSYARSDSRDFVARLSAALEERGKDPWVDLEDIPAASVWSEDLRAGIASSDSFCFVISPASVTSENCRTELERAVALNKRLLPVLHLPAADAEVPDIVGSRNWIPQTGRFLDDFDGNLATLVSAIETDLDWVREHTRWGLRAEEWERRNEDRSLLARGSDLEQAEAFLGGSGGRDPQPTELQGRYVLASRRAATRRQRQLVTGVSVALVVSVVLGVLALLQRNTAVEQRHEAERQRHEAETQSAAATSKALAANAFLNLPTDPELSLLLGIEAAKVSPTTEAEEALRSALLDSQVRLQLQHGAAVTSAAYSPDGTRIVTTSEDGTAVLWDAASGDQVSVLGGNTQPPQEARWSADGSRVVTISQDGTARVYDGVTGAEVSVITDPDENRLTDVAISADGSVVVTAAFVNGQVHAWNAVDGTLLATIPRSTVDRIALSPDNTLLLVVMQGEAVELWSTGDGNLVASYPEDAQGFFDAVAFSPDGSAFVTAGDDGLARVRSIDGTLVADVQHTAAVEAVAFSPDGDRLTTASEDGTARVTDLADGRTLATFAGHAGALDTIAFSPTGKLVATAGEDGVVRLWRPNGGAEVAALVGHRAPVNEVFFSPNGASVLSASDDSTARLWTTTGSAGAFPQRLSTPATDTFSAAFDAGGRYAVLSATDLDDPTTTVRTIDVATGDLSGEFTLADGEYFVPAVSADGTLTLTSDNDSTTRIRRTSDGSLVAALPVAHAYDAAFDAAGQRVLVGGDTGSAGIYDTGTGELLTELAGHDPAWEVVGAALTTDGSRALTASVDGTVRIWVADTGMQLLQVEAFQPPGRMYLQHAAVALSPDENVLATSAEYEEDARLWDTETGERLATLEGVKGGSVSDLAFSADGRFILTAALSGAVRLWDGHSGRLLAAVTDAAAGAGAATFTDRSSIAIVGQFDDQSALVVLDCEVCGDLDSLVDLAKTRVTRELTATEKATYLSSD
jgi:WD40 repeat protein